MSDHRAYRSKLYRKAHGEPAAIIEPAEGDTVAIEAYPFDFSSDEDDEDIGFVLITNGMSDRRMHLDAAANKAVASGEVKPRAELMWYVRSLEDHYLRELQWLASFPWIDKTWLGFGHTIPMPEPIFDGSELTAFLFLSPVVERHQALGDALEIEGDKVELLCVHLLTTAEYDRKRTGGVDAILDLFDENDHALVLDEERESYV